MHDPFIILGDTIVDANYGAQFGWSVTNPPTPNMSQNTELSRYIRFTSLPNRQNDFGYLFPLAKVKYLSSFKAR